MTTDSFANLPREAPGVRRGLWARRLVLLVFAAVALLGLLDVFGQKESESVASAPAATMSLSAPRAVRGGLLFQARLEIRAAQQIEEPRLVMDEGWFEGMQFNSIEPHPASEASRDGKVVLTYDALAPGDVLRIWVEFQVNPPNVGSRSFAVALDDATEPVVRIDRDITVLP
jgi:hypothetical protein